MFERESSSSESRSEESIPSEFVQRADEIIFAAKKLRHPVLFRECFIHLVDRLHGSFYYGSAFSALREDKDLWLLLSEGKSNLRQLILQAQNAILMASMDGLLRVDLKDQMIDALRADPENSAWFFKHMLDLRELTHCVNDEEAEEMFAPIEILLRSNLALDQTDFGAGEGPYKNIFLCAELADEDMPWDAAEFDW
jgi:hypothetical protein